MKTAPTRCLAGLLVTTLATFVLSAQAAAGGKSAAPTGDPAKGKEIAAAVCAACHQLDGNSATPENPKIAGQHAAYLFKQMKNFKLGADGKAERVNAIMNAMMAPYTDEALRDLAAWYASQTMSAGTARSPDALELGRKLYLAGDARKGLPACAGCHGPRAAGIPAQFPRLAGQYAEYLEAQLKAFRAGERSNDPNRMMQMVAAKMSDAEIRAVADYIAGLR